MWTYSSSDRAINILMDCHCSLMGERGVDVAVDGDIIVDGVCEGDGAEGFRSEGDIECFDRGGFGDGDGLAAG